MAQRSGISPWHMWGNTQTIEASGSATVSNPGVGQMLRIAYARPDSWHWIFKTTVLQAPEIPIPGNGAALDVFYDLTIGIGRSMIVLPEFEHHRWAYNFPNAAPVGFSLYTTSVPGNRLNNRQGVTLTEDPTVINEIVAQDIQLTTRLVCSTTAGLFTFRVEASAQFSPKTHIRPEWHEKRFPGAENGGGTSVMQQVQQLGGPKAPPIYRGVRVLGEDVDE